MTGSPPLPRLPNRDAASHKGDFGRAVLIGGGRGMAGAIALSGIACLRSGAGLVQLAVSEAVQSTVAAFEPSYMTVPLAEDAQRLISLAAKSTLEKVLKPATAVACGPGLGRSEDLTKLVHWLYHDLDKPLVIDADGLNGLAEQRENIGTAAATRILTPHPGEFARLWGAKAQTRDDMETQAVELAARLDVVIVLKGHRTLVTDGQRQAHNTTGNPGMATGGTGDVLTGICAGLLAQGLGAFEAAQLAVHVHGLAGDLAAQELGQVSLIASDLLRFLPYAFRQVEAQS